MRLALIIVALSACGGAQLKEPPARPTPFCFSVLGKWRSGQAVGKVCTEFEGLCKYARGLAVQFSGMANLAEVGMCSHEF